MSPLFYAVGASYLQKTVQRYNYFLIYANIFCKKIQKIADKQPKKRIAPQVNSKKEREGNEAAFPRDKEKQKTETPPLR